MGGTKVTLGVDEAGKGRSIVLLPALSSISTRAEMRPLFDRLASEFRVSTVGWPGFGDHARPRANWSPDLLSAFLNWFLNEIVPPPHAVIAARHAAAYALYQAVYQPESGVTTEQEVMVRHPAAYGYAARVSWVDKYTQSSLRRD